MFGDGHVGKTSIVNQFFYNKFVPTYKETIEDVYRETITIKDKKINLTILDTSGRYQFPAMRRLAIQNSDAFILVYSLDNKASLTEMRRLYNIIVNTKQTFDIPIIVAANKCDKEKIEISFDEMKSLEKSWLTPFTKHIEISARSNINIEKLFHTIFDLADQITEKLDSLAKKDRRHSLARLRLTVKKSVCKTFTT